MEETERTGRITDSRYLSLPCWSGYAFWLRRQHHPERAHPATVSGMDLD